MEIRFGLLTVLLCAFTALPACTGALRYSAEPIEAWVVDAETRKPLEGVVVTANWQLEEGTFGGNVQLGQLMVMEAVTDKDGRFTFPGFPVKTVWKGHLVNEDPQLLLFKSGYEYQRLYNHISFSAYREHVLRPVRRSDWNGKKIALKPFKGAVEEYEKQFNDFNRELDHIVSRRPEDCEWKKIPRVILAMKQQRQTLDEKGARHFYSIDQRLVISDEYFRAKGGSECGSPADFIKGLEP